MLYHGDIRLGDTLDIKFTTVDTAGVPTVLSGSPVISAYVGNNTTEITAGITLSVDFDGRVGLNNVRVVATSGNGFATATNVELIITTGTVSGSSVVGYCVGSFSIENRSALMPTTAGRTATINSGGDIDANVTKLLGTAWLTPGTAGTPDVNVKLWNALTTVALPLVPTTAGRTLDVSTTGEAGIDWANIGSPTTTVNLSGTTIKAVTDAVSSNVTAINGVSTASVTAVNANLGTTQPVNFTGTGASALAKSDVVDIAGAAVNTATAQVGVNVVSYASGQAPLQPTVAGRTLDVSAGGEAGVDWANVGSPTTAVGLTNTTISTTQAVASVSGAVGSVTGAVGSVAGNVVGSVGSVAGNVTGSVGSIAAGGITAASFAMAAIDANALATDAVQEIVDGVWDEAIASHLSAGSTGEALNTASAGGSDPWATALPGAYIAGTAGHILGTGIPDIAPGAANGLLRGGTNAATSITTALTANVIGNITGNLSGSVGSVTGAVGSVTGAVGSVSGNVGGNVTGSVGSVAAGGITAASFAANAIDATALATTAVTEIATGILAAAVEGTITVAQSLRLCNSANASKLSGAATATVKIRDIADTKDRITASVDASGNRTAITLDVTP